MSLRNTILGVMGHYVWDITIKWFLEGESYLYYWNFSFTAKEKKKKDKESVDEIPEAVQTERRARKCNTKGSNVIEERTVNDVQCRKDIEDDQDWAKGIYINFFLYW